MPNIGTNWADLEAQGSQNYRPEGHCPA